MSRNICIVVLMGLPAVGKTTFVSQYRDYDKQRRHMIHVCYDDLIPIQEQREASKTEKKWKEMRKNVLDAVETLIVTHFLKVSNVVTNNDCNPILNLLMKTTKNDERIENDDRRSIVIFIDDNNYLSSMRHEYYKMCLRLEIGFCQFEFRSAPSLRRDRNEKRENPIPDEIVDRMSSKYEPPDPLKNSWEQFSFSIENRSDFPFVMCESIIDMAAENPCHRQVPQVSEEVQDASRMACNASVVHRADKILRKKVSEFIANERKSSDSSEIARRSKELNGIRTELLDDLKTGFTKVPVDIVKNIGEKGEKGQKSLEQLNTLMEELFRLKISK